METRHLRLGVVQIDCKVGDVPGNLAHGGELVAEAARQGAQIVLLPELMPSGYSLTEAIWDCAERFHGPTTGWLAHTAKQHHIFVGTTFLEVEGEHFYNTFALAAPDGTVAGKVRKCPPASLEAFFYTSGSTTHVVETDLGRIGVGICIENLLYDHLLDLQRQSVDLVLQPMAAGRIMPMKPGDTGLFDSMVKRGAPYYARALGVPVAMADRTGPFETDLPANLGKMVSTFPGFSQIVDSDGAVKGRMGGEEGVLVAEVILDPRRRKEKKLRCYDKMWAIPVPWFAFTFPETQHMGEQAYAENPRRSEQALRKQ